MSYEFCRTSLVQQWRERVRWPNWMDFWHGWNPNNQTAGGSWPRRWTNLDRAWCLIEYTFQNSKGTSSMTFIICESNKKEKFSPVHSGKRRWAQPLGTFWVRTVGGAKAGREGEGHGEALSVPVSLLPTLHSFLPGEKMVKPERKRSRRKKR